MLHRHMARGRERNALRAAFEQLRSRCGLEVGEPPARCGEREVARLRALGDAARLGDAQNRRSVTKSTRAGLIGLAIGEF